MVLAVVRSTYFRRIAPGDPSMVPDAGSKHALAWHHRVPNSVAVIQEERGCSALWL